MVLAKGLEATEASWPEIRMASGWVRRLAAVLADKEGLDAATVRRRYRGVIAALARHRGRLGTLTGAVQFVSRGMVGAVLSGAKTVGYRFGSGFRPLFRPPEGKRYRFDRKHL